MVARIKLLGRMDWSRSAARSIAHQDRAACVDGVLAAKSRCAWHAATAFGEKMVMRIFDPDTWSRASRRWLRRARGRALVRTDGAADGIILSPAHRSGKTTTAVRDAQTAGDGGNVCTSRSDRDDSNRRSPDPGAGCLDLEFADACVTDAAGPDIIMVARSATWHRRDGDPGGADRPPVFSTLHTNDAASAVTRWSTSGAALHDLGHRDRRAGAAPGAHAVPACKQRDTMPARPPCWPMRCNVETEGAPRVYKPVGCSNAA